MAPPVNQELLQSVRKCPELPTLPRVAMQIVELARCPDVDIRDLADLISNDPALSSRILRTVNSSFYGLSNKVSTISQALVVLGLQSVKTLALGFSLVGTLNKAHPHGFDHMNYWRRSIYSAVAARTLCEHLKLVQTEEVFLAALLQDIGTLAIHTAVGDKYGELFSKASRHDELPALEAAEFGLDHAQVGKAMADGWSLPPLLSEPIAEHHHPQQVSDPQLKTVCQVVHLGWLYAEVFMQSRLETDKAQEAARAIAEARCASEQMFELTSQKADMMLERVGLCVREAADLFEVNIGKHEDYQSILGQARDALMEMTLQTQRLAANLENQNRRLAEEACTDPLTGVANRRKIMEFLEQNFEQSRQARGSLGVLFIDVDHFKIVNDTFGHAAGDCLLRDLAQTIQSACRPGDSLGRYGGEEFLCVLAESNLRNTARMAESIRQSVQCKPIQHENQSIPVTVSIGAAAMERGDFFTSAGQLLQSADRAMYAAKRGGRNLVRIFNAAAAAAARH